MDIKSLLDNRSKKNISKLIDSVMIDSKFHTGNVNDLLLDLIGYYISVLLFKKNNYTMKESIKKVSTLNFQDIDLIKLYLSTRYKLNIEKIFDKYYKICQKITKLIDKDTIIICPGSSTDKICFILELMGYTVHYIPFSTDYFTREYSTAIKNLNKYYSDDILSSLCKTQYITLLKKYKLTENMIKNKKIAIIDYVHEGKNLYFLNRLLINCFNLDKDNILLLGLVDKKLNSNPNSELEKLTPSKIKFIKINSFIGEKINIIIDSKGHRCIPYTSRTNKIKLIKYNINVCNLYRIWLTIIYLKL